MTKHLRKLWWPLQGNELWGRSEGEERLNIAQSAETSLLPEINYIYLPKPITEVPKTGSDYDNNRDVNWHSPQSWITKLNHDWYASSTDAVNPTDSKALSNMCCWKCVQTYCCWRGREGEGREEKVMYLRWYKLWLYFPALNKSKLSRHWDDWVPQLQPQHD